MCVPTQKSGILFPNIKWDRRNIPGWHCRMGNGLSAPVLTIPWIEDENIIKCFFVMSCDAVTCNIPAHASSWLWTKPLCLPSVFHWMQKTTVLAGVVT
jgi:hypothetical protein